MFSGMMALVIDRFLSRIYPGQNKSQTPGFPNWLVAIKHNWQPSIPLLQLFTPMLLI